MQAVTPLTQAAALLGDPNRTWATASYLAPLMQLQLSKFVEHVLKIPDLGAITDVVIVSDVAAATTNMESYMLPGGDLELLNSVIGMKERAANSESPNDWRDVYPRRDVPTFNPGQFRNFYAWTGETIVLPEAAQDTDIRIFGKFNPEEVIDDNSAIVPATSPYLAYATAATVAMSRNNPSMYTAYMAEAEAIRRSYLTNAIMEVQAVRARIRSYTGRSNELF